MAEKEENIFAIRPGNRISIFIGFHPHTISINSHPYFGKERKEGIRLSFFPSGQVKKIRKYIESNDQDTMMIGFLMILKKSKYNLNYFLFEEDGKNIQKET